MRRSKRAKIPNRAAGRRRDLNTRDLPSAAAWERIRGDLETESDAESGLELDCAGDCPNEAAVASD